MDSGRDQTGWNATEGTSHHPTLKSYVAGLSDDEARTVLADCNAWLKRIDNPTKVKHVVDTAFYCATKLNKDRL